MSFLFKDRLIMSLTVWQLDPVNLTPYYNIALCDALVEAGCQVRYITSRFLYDDHLPFSGSFQSDNLYFKGLHQPILLKLPAIRKLLRGLSYPLGHQHVLRELRQQPPAVLHIQWCRLPRLDRWFIQQVQQMGIPVVLTVHEVVPLYEKSDISPHLIAIYRDVDALIVLSEASRHHLLRHVPTLDRSHITVIPLLDREYTRTPANASRSTARASLNLPDDVPVILYFGTIKRYKGLDVLIEAMPLIHVQQPDVHLVIAGHPDESELTTLEKARTLPQTRLDSGFIPYEDVWRYFYAADLVVFPYRDVYQSAALTSAMGFGKPIIATDVGSFNEIVDGNGWIVPPENPQALADAIITALRDTSALNVMGQRSRELIETRFAPGAIAQQTINVYEQVLGR